MNGLGIFQIRAPSEYTGEDFNEDLCTVLHQAGFKGEKTCFIMDKSNVLDWRFFKWMNTLLANEYYALLSYVWKVFHIIQ